MTILSLPALKDAINNPIGTSGWGPYRLFGDSHIVTMCFDYPEIFELHWYIMYKAYSLVEHLTNVGDEFTPGRINLFMAGMPPTDHKEPAVFLNSASSLVTTTCASFVHELCRLRDKGASVAALSPCPTAVPNSADEEHKNVATFLAKVGGYDSWKSAAQMMVSKLQEICVSEGVDFIDVYHALVHPLSGDTPSALRAGDGWHLNAAAGHVIAVCVHEFFGNKRVVLSA